MRDLTYTLGKLAIMTIVISCIVGLNLHRVKWLDVKFKAWANSMASVYTLDVMIVGVCLMVLFSYLWLGRPAIIQEMEQNRVKQQIQK